MAIREYMVATTHLYRGFLHIVCNYAQTKLMFWLAHVARKLVPMPSLHGFHHMHTQHCSKQGRVVVGCVYYLGFLN